MADQAAGLAPGELGDVGVLLLREHRAPGGVGVVERQKPNSSVDHSTISSPRRERCTPSSARSKSASATKSRSDTASSEFSKRRGSRAPRPRSRGRAAGTTRPARPRRAATTFSRSTVVEQSVDVAGEGPAVREQVVREQHRLGPLQVRVARAGRRRRPRAARWASDVLERDDLAGDADQRAAGTTAAGRWPPGRCGCARCGAWRRVARELGDPPLDRGVDVLVARREDEAPVVRTPPRPCRARRASVRRPRCR